MAIAFRDAISTEQAATGSSVAATIPSTVQSNDGLLAWVTVAGTAATITTPAGWTLVYGPLDKTTVLREYAFKRVATGADAGAVLTFTLSTSTAAKRYITLGAWSGTDTTDFVMDSAAVVETAAATAHTTPTVTVTGTGAWLVEHVGDRGSPSSTDFTVAGMTERVKQVGTGTGTMTVEINDSNGAVSAGTQGGHTYTSASSVSAANATMSTIALKPAGGTGATVTPSVIAGSVSFSAPTLINGSNNTVIPGRILGSVGFPPLTGSATAVAQPNAFAGAVTVSATGAQGTSSQTPIPEQLLGFLSIFPPVIVAADGTPVDPGTPPPSTGRFRFRSPQYIESWPIQAGERLAVKVAVNKTMYRINNVWRAGTNLTYVEIDAADRVYYGGYDYDVPDGELAEMVSQGFDVAVEIEDDVSAGLFLAYFSETF
jgi:hypothetical protein